MTVSGPNRTNSAVAVATKSEVVKTSQSAHPLYKYFVAATVGAGRGLVSLPIEHPFDTIKTRVQATQKPIFSAVHIIIKNEGVGGFYAGAIPNAIRLATKQVYRYPMMLALPPFFEGIIPRSMQEDHKTLPQIATGLTIAHFETGFICPWERLKTYLMTKEDVKGKKIRQFIQEHRGAMWSEVTRGLNAVYVRQMATWVSFLVADKKFKDMERERTKTQQLSFESLLRVSLMVGSVNTLANMPFDVLKTQLQQSKFIHNEGVIQTMHKIYLRYGAKGLYAGWQVRMLQYMIQSAFTVTILDQLEGSFKKK